MSLSCLCLFFFQAEDGIRDYKVTGVQTCALPIFDTAPTILDLLGLRVPENLQGTSLLDPNPRMSLFFTDYSLGWLGLYDACRKYLFEINSDRSKLYDVCNDPGETNDLSDREHDRTSAYRLRLEEWIAAQRR